jgi:hypothetical protein
MLRAGSCRFRNARFLLLLINGFWDNRKPWQATKNDLWMDVRDEGLCIFISDLSSLFEKLQCELAEDAGYLLKHPGRQSK